MYNKLFTKILDSSIWLETDATRIVWLTLIAAMDETGFVQFASVANLAHRARVTEEGATQAVQRLESPDKNSSDPDHEGRRIERVPGGWIILNAEKYRDLVTRAIAQEKTRQRVAKFRAKQHAVTNGNGDVTPANVSVTPSEAFADIEASNPADKPPKVRDSLFDSFAVSCGTDPFQLTASAARTVAVKLAEIRKASPEVKPDDFLPRALRYRAIFPTASLTPSALCAHWAECDPSKPLHDTNPKRNDRGFSQRNDYSKVENHGV